VYETGKFALRSSGIREVDVARGFTEVFKKTTILLGGAHNKLQV
jgi:hypothetical protein